MGFVGIYSGLAHKELRFVVYAVVAFDLIAAIGIAGVLQPILDKDRRNRKKGVSWRVGSGGMGVAVVFGVSLGMTVISAYVSMYNYPAAHALRYLHSYHHERVARGNGTGVVDVNEPVAHIDRYAAMNGITRFLEIDRMRYSKDEEFDGDSKGLVEKFDYLVTERKDVQGFERVKGIEGFERIGRGGRLGVELQFREKVFVHVNKIGKVVTESIAPSFEKGAQSNCRVVW